MPLDRPVSFDHDQEALLPSPGGDGNTSALEAAPASISHSGKKWNARVILLQGLDAAARDDVLRGAHNGGQNLVTALR